MLSGWGRYPMVSVTEIFPRDAGAISKIIHEPFTARGLGRSYGDASLPRMNYQSLNTQKLNRMLSFNPSSGVLDAESGVTLEAILAVSIPRGFFLPVTPGTVHVTLGGALASNVHGKNHHRRGSIEHFVLELEVMTSVGNKICSPTLLPELFKATVGGYGLTGLITRAKLQLKSIHNENVEVLRIKAPDLQSLFQLFKKYDAQYEYSVAWIDCLARGNSMGRGILMLGNHSASPKDSQESIPHSQRAMRSKSSKGSKLTLPAMRIPFPMPRFFLNRWFLTLFNQLFYSLASKKEKSTTENFRPYFYPLDALENWNLLYGRDGFFQYQCVIPDPQSETGIAACLEFLSGEGVGAFLSVLKRCGDDNVLLPFCKKGYTLALDIPFRGEVTLRLLDKLDELVLTFQGRVYLTKDARLSPVTFRKMYP